MVSKLFQVLLSFKFDMPYHVDDDDLTKLFKFELIQICECALNWFILERLYECMLDNYHLRNLGATYHEHVFVDPCVQIIPN